MAEGLVIKVSNGSSKSWTRNNWHIGAGQDEALNWPDEITKTPLENLEAADGETTAAVHSEQLSSLVKDALWMQLGYGCAGEGNFGVHVQQYFHLFGIGRQCDWQIYENDQWTALTNSADVHTWTFATTKVVATPTLGSDGASVEIFITDLPKAP